MKELEKSKLKDLNKAVDILKKGGVVIIPTDTVYGIACKWDNLAAVSRIKRVKSSTQDFFPVLVSSIAQAHMIAKISPHALSLINKHWPGGLTVIVRSKKTDEKIGIRMPDSKVTQYVIENLGSPIIGTSANFHGQQAPTSKYELDPKLVSLVDFVVDGKCDRGVESTVIDTTVAPMKVLRHGAVQLT